MASIISIKDLSKIYNTGFEALKNVNLEINKGDVVSDFHEKPDGDGGYINGGFFVLSPEVLNYIDGDMTIWEKDPMKRLSKEKQLNAFKHSGFWRPMDTLRDKNFLKNLWDSKKAPWKTW